MELILNRVNYLQVGIANKKCMKLPPLGNKDVTHKIAIADNSGVFQILSKRKDGLIIHFKSELPTPPAVVELGGRLKDKIFVGTTGGKILGFTKKGKQIFELSADLTEPIRSMYIEGTDIFTAGDFTFKHYKESDDSFQTFLCQEKIADIICLPSEKLTELVPVLACCDRTLKIMKDSKVHAELQISSVPQCLCLYGNDGGYTGDKVLYGTIDGKLGLAKVNRFLQEVVWEFDPPHNKTSAGISCITNFDVTCNGYADIIIGRDDGWIEIYELDELERPIIKYSTCLNESITSIQGGNVGSSDYIEIVCSTYSGWLIGLTTEPIGDRKPRLLMLSDSQLLSSSFVDKTQEEEEDAKLVQMRKDVGELEKKVEEERENYKTEAKKPGQMSSFPTVPVNHRFIFNSKDAEYLLTLETQTPMEFVLLQCDVPVDLIDLERNHAIVSFTPCTPEEGNGLLATFRCQASATRLDIKVQPLEGQHGLMRAYVTPRLQPKVCQVVTFPIKPLSLHYRIHKVDDTRPFNQLHLHGDFEISDIHTWLTHCLPEIPEKVPSGDACNFCFASAYLGTMLQCSYHKGEIYMKSDNISTISILKDNLTKQATNQGIKLEISFEVDDSTVVHVLRSVSPRISELILLSKKVQLLDGLKELRTQEGSGDFLSGELRDILEQADELTEQHKQQNQLLKRLYGIIKDLYMDWYKFKGRSVRDRLPKLMDVIKRHNLDELLQFFEESI